MRQAYIEDNINSVNQQFDKYLYDNENEYAILASSQLYVNFISFFYLLFG